MFLQCTSIEFSMCKLNLPVMNVILRDTSMEFFMSSKMHFSVLCAKTVSELRIRFPVLCADKNGFQNSELLCGILAPSTRPFSIRVLPVTL